MMMMIVMMIVAVDVTAKTKSPPLPSPHTPLELNFNNFIYNLQLPISSKQEKGPEFQSRWAPPC
jgi:hypothetical protein